MEADLYERGAIMDHYETPESLKNIKKFYEKRKEIKEVNNMNICKTCLNESIIEVLESRIDYLEDKIKNLGLGNTAKILNQNKIVADYAELLAQNKLFKKTLGKFMGLMTKPGESGYQVREFYSKLKKLIRELNR